VSCQLFSITTPQLPLSCTGPILAGVDAPSSTYDTIAWTEWRVLAERLADRLGVDAATLLRAFEVTRQGRGTGKYGNVAGDLGAVAEVCGIVAHETVLSELAADTVRFLQQTVHLYDDVLPVLRKLRSSGTRVAVISNCDHATRPVIDALGLEREVDSVVLSFEVACVKPDAQIFLEALERLQVAPRTSVFVDDQARYLDGAAALGIRTLRIARAVSFGETSASGSHPVISDLMQIV
jgi:HAD superfamily hydrolase (TIGR01509 family)